MSTSEVNQQQSQFQTLNIRKEVDIDAPVAITFESILEEIGPGSVLEDGTPFHMKLEAFPGGRWFRDLGNNMGNAAVMGLFPQVRYILLSDLLLETMTDEQVEAVFAHEVGHIVHRHMAWYVVLIVIPLGACVSW